MNYLERPARRGFVIIGEAGSIEWEGTEGVPLLRRRDGRAPETFSPPAGFERNDLFLDELRHVMAVLAGGPARTSGSHWPPAVMPLLWWKLPNAQTGRTGRGSAAWSWS